MKHTFTKDDNDKSVILSSFYNNGDFMGYPLYTIVEEYSDRIDNVTIPRLIRELESEGIIEIDSKTLGPCFILSDLGMRIFRKHGDYLTYLLHLEKEKRKADKYKSDLATAKKGAVITNYFLIAITAAVGLLGLWHNHSIDRLKEGADSTATQLQNLKQTIERMQQKLSQLPDSTKVK